MQPIDGERLRAAQFRVVVQTVRAFFCGRNAGAYHVTHPRHLLTTFYTRENREDFLEVSQAEASIYHHHVDASGRLTASRYALDDVQTMLKVLADLTQARRASPCREGRA